MGEAGASIWTDDDTRRWSTNDVLDAFDAAGFSEHDAAIVVSLMKEQRERSEP